MWDQRRGEECQRVQKMNLDYSDSAELKNKTEKKIDQLHDLTIGIKYWLTTTALYLQFYRVNVLNGPKASV